MPRSRGDTDRGDRERGETERYGMERREAECGDTDRGLRDTRDRDWDGCRRGDTLRVVIRGEPGRGYGGRNAVEGALIVACPGAPAGSRLSDGLRACMPTRLCARLWLGDRDRVRCRCDCAKPQYSPVGSSCSRRSRNRV